jgi:hypothetical protein
MAHPDLDEARIHVGALRGVIIHHGGGWPDDAALMRGQSHCRAAHDAIDDEECRERMDDIAVYIADLYSEGGHQKWQRKQTSGADFLRLRVLRELDAFTARLDEVAALRRALEDGDLSGARTDL